LNAISIQMVVMTLIAGSAKSASACPSVDIVPITIPGAKRLTKYVIPLLMGGSISGEYTFAMKFNSVFSVF